MRSNYNWRTIADAFQFGSMVRVAICSPLSAFYCLCCSYFEAGLSKCTLQSPRFDPQLSIRLTFSFSPGDRCVDPPTTHNETNARRSKKINLQRMAVLFAVFMGIEIEKIVLLMSASESHYSFHWPVY